MGQTDGGAIGSPLGHLTWIAGACVVGFLVSFLGVDRAALARDWFVLVHVAVTGGFLAAYAAKMAFGARNLLAHWRAGLALGALAGAFSVSFVFSQPPSAGPDGAHRVLSVVWLGVVYGVVDALLLTLLPVYSVWCIARTRGWLRRLRGRTACAASALVASVMVTVAYHLGFPEFRGAEILQPVIGNGVITLAYILSRSPLAPIGAHVALHTAAVVHAYQTSIPLPPHY